MVFLWRRMAGASLQRGDRPDAVCLLRTRPQEERVPDGDQRPELARTAREPRAWNQNRSLEPGSWNDMNCLNTEPGRQLSEICSRDGN